MSRPVEPVTLRGAFLRRVLALAVATGALLVVTVAVVAGRGAQELALVRARTVSSALVTALSASSAREREVVVHRLRRRGLAVAVTEADRLVAGGVPRVTAAGLRRWAAAEAGTDGRWAYAARTLPPPRQDEVAIVAVPVPSVASVLMLGGDEHGRMGAIPSLALVSVAFLGLLLAAAVLMARELASELSDLGGRMRTMAGAGAASEVPITTLDELGDLERAFNRLWSRHRLEIQRHADAQVVLDQADRYKSEFLATVSHELRTPLNPILGFSQVLLTGMDGPLTQSQVEDLKIIEQSGAHLLSLINDILDLSAMESGRIDLRREPTALGELAREVVRTSEGQLRGKKLRLASEVPDDLPLCHADPKRLRQILLNLLSNAIKFTDRGEVVIEASRAGNGELLEIRVRDTGPGIPSSETKSIFEEYKQLGETTRRRRGTGLGLAIVKRLVELHEGTIRVESQIGQGSTFVVTLPVVRPEAVAAPPASVAPSPAASEAAR